MRIRAGARLGFFLVLTLGPQAVFSHHSVSANFDRAISVEITGTVTAFYLRNPHSHLELDVVDEDGSVAQWLIEWGTRNDLIRRGVDVNRIQVGDKLTVTLMPSRQLEHVGYMRSAILPDGSTIRDCGYAAFREALVNEQEFECDETVSEQ